MWHASVIAFVILCLRGMHAAPSTDPDAIRKICRTSFKANDPVCEHGGILHADNSTGDPFNCNHCDCPPEWTGRDCSLCTNSSFCPTTKPGLNGTVETLIGCTYDSIEPSPLEYYLGKNLSCECGGYAADKITPFYCSMQPKTFLDLHIKPSSKDFDWDAGNAAAYALETAGTPSQDFWPCNRPGCFASPERYRFAYPGVWDGNFTKCSWKYEDCVKPQMDGQCLVYTCTEPHIACPNENAPKCPGWTSSSCGNPPNETKPYWSHRCAAISYPQNNSVTKLYCNPKLQHVDGVAPYFQCYISLSVVSPMGLRCRTGACIYNSSRPLPPRPPTPGPKPPGWRPHMRHPEMAMISLVGVGVAALVAATLLIIHADTEEQKEQLAHWNAVGADQLPDLSSNGHVTGIDLDESGCLTLSWDSIQLTIVSNTGSRRRVLKSVCGVSGLNPAHPNDSNFSMFAIMGPSGAGKTSLMDILAGRRTGPGIKGEVRVDGQLVTPEQMHALSGYVMQDDVLPGTLTVWEYICFHAVLRLRPELYDTDQRRVHAMQILKELGLMKVAHTMIGDAYMRGLSGGEKRRVSIAVELLTRPGLMFLDEPTTGLDSTNASKVVDVLAELANMGVNVLMTIHQPRPDIFRLMSRVMLLSSSGQVVYTGRVAAATEFFASLGYQPRTTSVNIADYMLDTVIRARSDQLETMVETFARSRVAIEDHAWVSSLTMNPAKSLPGGKFQASFWTQLKVLASRRLRNTYRHPFLITCNFLATLAMAVALGFIFHNTGNDMAGIQNRLGVIFFMLLYLSLMGLSSLPVWREEKLVFLRERDSGIYGTPAYFTAVLLFDLIPLRMIPPTFFAIISYWMIGLHMNCASCVLWFIVLLVLSNVASATMCMAIGAATPSNPMANMVGSLMLLVFLLFGGFLLNRDRVPVYVGWLSSLSYFNYAYEALVMNEFLGAPIIFNITAPVDTIPAFAVTGKGVLQFFHFNWEAPFFYWDVMMLLMITAFCCLTTFFFLYMSGHPIWPLLQQLWGNGVHALAARVAPFSSNTARKLFGHSSSPRASSPMMPRTLWDTNDHSLLGADLARDFHQDPYYPNGHTLSLREEALTTIEAEEDLDPEFTNGSYSDGADAGIVNTRAGPHARRASHARHASYASTRSQQSEPLLIDEGRIRTSGWDEEPDPRVLSWENVCWSVWTNSGACRTVLQSVSGVAGRQVVIEPPLIAGIPASQGSCMFAILGPSGAGKTTLIEILSGRKRGPGITGEIRVDGHLVQPRTLRKLSGCVPQEDVFPGTSSVREYLLFHAKLRLPLDTSPAQLKARVQRIAQQLGLTKVLSSYIGDAMVRGISGGERRRVSIATELLTLPCILFLDEPTTGLDSTNALQVVDVLAGLSGAGTNVMMSIHQPRQDIFQMLDRLLILSSEGQVVYTGQSARAVEHFRHLGFSPSDPSINIADYLLDLVIKSHPDVVQDLVRAFPGSAAAQENEEWTTRLQLGQAYRSLHRAHEMMHLKKYESGYGRQLQVLSQRLLRNVYRHPFLIALNFVATLVMALGIGSIYFHSDKNTGGIQNRFGSLFFMLMYQSVMSLSSLPLWHDDRLLMIRERTAGAYGTSAYFSVVLLFDILLMRLLPPLLFTVVAYPLIGLREGLPYMLTTLLVLVMHNITAASLSMAIGAATPSVSEANMVGSLAVLTTNLFGGFFLSRAGSLTHPPGFVSLLGNLSYVRFAFEALSINEFEGARGFRFTAHRQPGQDPADVPHINVTGAEILQVFGFHSDSFWVDISVLGLFSAVYLSAAYFLLKYRGRV